MDTFDIIIQIAFSAFIAHGFLDFWPIFKTWDWKISLPSYIISSLSGVYFYSIAPQLLMLLFFLFSAYHFGSDWTHLTSAMFLGSTMLGMAAWKSSETFGYFGIPDSKLFGIVYGLCGIFCIIPSYNKKALIFMIPLGMLGIYGIMIYAIFIHTPRSVYLLAQKYGNSIYLWWPILTIFTFILLHLFEIVSIKSGSFIGLGFGILFAHMICTAYWREAINTYQLLK